MKPTTKLHHEVWNISQKLNPITESQHKLAVKNIFSKYGTTSHKTLCCLECGHKWKDANSFQNGYRPKSYTCPECKEKIEFLQPSRYYQVNSYFTKIETKSNFQIVRIFFMEKLMYKGTIPMYYTTEVMQHFIGLNGRVTSLAKPTQGMTMYYDSWRKYGDLSIMANDFLTTNRGRIESNYTLPRPTFLKEITRNGFNGNYYDLAPQNLFSLLLKSQHAETLIKSGQIGFIKNFNSRESQIKKYWNSIKICIRNKYEIKNTTSWFDYMRLLEVFGKDLSSPKYVCPDHLIKSHDKLVAKERVIREKQAIEELKKQAIEQQAKYKAEKEPFFGISFTNGKITVKVIDDVQDFILIGDTLKHCVYSGEYFDKKESLILSATFEDRPIETIEVSLSEMKILQARGLQNKASKFNKEIKQLVNANLHQIRKANQQLKSA
jgi:hypothetical protein